MTVSDLSPTRATQAFMGCGGSKEEEKTIQTKEEPKVEVAPVRKQSVTRRRVAVRCAQPLATAT